MKQRPTRSSRKGDQRKGENHSSDKIPPSLAVPEKPFSPRDKLSHQNDRVRKPAWVANREIQEKSAHQHRRGGIEENLPIH